jgi:Protein of unknown function (DUF2510)
MTNDTASPSDLRGQDELEAYRGLAPGWYQDPDDPTIARHWDGFELSEEMRSIDSPRYGADSESDAYDEIDAIDEIEETDGVELMLDIDDSQGADQVDDIGDVEETCGKCHRPGLYYATSEWWDKEIDDAGALVLVGSKYSDELTCLTCETELDSQHTPSWVAVWAQRPRPRATRQPPVAGSLSSVSTS